ncbi:MAG: hypothetical protein GY930_04480 [bacterium]|nr:hypothetical protein [bacterium]
MKRFQETETPAEVVLIEGQASLTVEPKEVHIGQPVVWTLSVEHATGDGLPAEIAAPLNIKENWVLRDGPQTLTETLANGRMRTDVQWTYFSLRPGSRTPSDYALTLKRGAPLKVELQSLQVLGELEPGEEAPREMAPIREIEAGPSGHGALWLGAGFVAILALVLWRFSRRRASVEVAAAPETVWKGLKEAQVSQDAQTARQSLFDWHRDLRAGVDSALDMDLGALTDGDWFARLRTAQAAGTYPLDEMQNVLEELEQLKYQEPLPGQLTLNEVCTRVQALAATLEQKQGTGGQVA